MKLIKNIVGIIEVATVAIVMLTGCGIKNDGVKTYEKENDAAAQYVSENHKTEYTDGQEAVRKVLKETDWKAYSGMRNDYDSRLIEVKYDKTYVDDVAIYLVDVVDTSADAHRTYAVTYENGNVRICKNPITTEYAEVVVDKNNGVVASIGDVEGEMELYAIEDGEFVKFAYSTYDGEEHYYVGDKPVSKSYFFGDIDVNNAKHITAENVDDIIK